MFVAGFIGTPPMNFLRMELSRSGSRYMALSDNMQIRLPPWFAPYLNGYNKQKMIIGIRPKDLSLNKLLDSDSLDDQCAIQGKFLLKESIGDEVLYYFNLAQDIKAGNPFIVKETTSIDFNRQEAVEIFINTKEIYLFDADSGNALLNGDI